MQCTRPAIREFFHGWPRLAFGIATGLLLPLLMGLSSDAAAAPLDQVSLQLKWHHQFQFAGYYAAQAKGYYTDEGLEVSLLEGGVGRSPIPAVLNGNAQFGVGDSDVLLARMNGKPLVACAAIFQHSPYIIMSRQDRNIRTPADLIGTKVMMADNQGAAQLKAVMIREGIAPDRVQIVPHSWNLNDLIEGKVDAISAYSTVEPAQLRSRGIEPAMIRSVDYGVDFYGDTLFTTEQEIAEHPKRVAGFLRASLKGWDYALNHPEWVSELILRMRGVTARNVTRETLMREAVEMRPLILPDVVEIGHMNIGRWQQIASTFATLGMAPPFIPTEDFAYDPHPAHDLGLVRWTVGAGAAGLILAALASIWNVQIRRQVRKRTRELHDEVSHRLEVESELRANEERFRLMFAGAATGIVVIAPTGRVINANPAYCAMVGYSVGELQEMDFTSLTHPIERAQNVVFIERLLCGDADHFVLEQRCLKKNGTAFWVRASVSIVRTAAGKPMKLIAVTEDISGRKSAEEEAQRASEVQAGIVQVQQEIASASLGLQAVMDLIAERARTLTDADGGVVELIEGHEMVYRATAGLAEREIGLRLKREGSLSGEVARTGKVLICEDSELDDRVDRAACRKVRARSMVVAPLRANEQVIGVLKVLSERPCAFTKRDVSNLQILVESLGAVIQRQQADAKVREQAALLDKAQDAILVRRLDHRITYWNKSAERLYGWTAKEAFALEGVERLYQDGDAFKEACIHVEQTGEWFGELKQTSKCGRSLIVEGRWTLVRNHDGEPSEILSINTDITEKKELEHQFLRAQRMESIGTLAGGIAHDLNNVLAPIMMGIGLLKMTERDEMRLGILSTIDLSAERGADMLRQLLTFARGVEGKRLEIDVKNLVDDIEKIVNETFLKYIRIRTVIPSDLWSLRGDPTQLHQVLLNLCMNARDAMPEGGMLKVVLRNFEADAAFALLHADARLCSYIVIRVEDNGMGMQSDVLERIFDPFYTTKELGKGTGLGLSTSLAIVKSHGGFINVQTEVGSGSVFEVYLPAQIERPEDAAPVIEAVAAHGNDELILVVDDEASIREVTQEMLETFGYRVLVASDGKDALAIYASRPEEIAVVISDMMMPGMDGAATIRALLEMNPDLPIIAASGLSAAGQSAIADQLGAQFFLSKPYSAESLLKTLRQAIHAQRD